MAAADSAAPPGPVRAAKAVPARAVRDRRNHRYQRARRQRRPPDPPLSPRQASLLILTILLNQLLPTTTCTKLPNLDSDFCDTEVSQILTPFQSSYKNTYTDLKIELTSALDCALSGPNSDNSSYQSVLTTPSDCILSQSFFDLNEIERETLSEVPIISEFLIYTGSTAYQFNCILPSTAYLTEEENCAAAISRLAAQYTLHNNITFQSLKRSSLYRVSLSNTTLGLSESSSDTQVRCKRTPEIQELLIQQKEISELCATHVSAVIDLVSLLPPANRESFQSLWYSILLGTDRQFDGTLESLKTVFSSLSPSQIHRIKDNLENLQENARIKRSIPILSSLFRDYGTEIDSVNKIQEKNSERANYNFALFSKENKFLRKNAQKVSKYLEEHRSMLSELEIQMTKENFIQRIQQFGVSAYATLLSHYKDTKDEIKSESQKIHELYKLYIQIRLEPGLLPALICQSMPDSALQTKEFCFDTTSSQIYVENHKLFIMQHTMDFQSTEQPVIRCSPNGLSLFKYNNHYFHYNDNQTLMFDQAAISEDCFANSTCLSKYSRKIKKTELLFENIYLRQIKENIYVTCLNTETLSSTNVTFQCNSTPTKLSSASLPLVSARGLVELRISDISSPRHLKRKIVSERELKKLIKNHKSTHKQRIHLGRLHSKTQFDLLTQEMVKSYSLLYSTCTLGALLCLVVGILFCKIRKLFCFKEQEFVARLNYFNDHGSSSQSSMEQIGRLPPDQAPPPPYPGRTQPEQQASLPGSPVRPRPDRHIRQVRPAEQLYASAAPAVGCTTSLDTGTVRAAAGAAAPVEAAAGAAAAVGGAVGAAAPATPAQAEDAATSLLTLAGNASFAAARLGAQTVLKEINKKQGRKNAVSSEENGPNL